MFISCKRGLALFSLFTLLCFSACHDRHSDPTPGIHSAPATAPVEIDDAEDFDHSLNSVPPLRLSRKDWDKLAAEPCGGNDFLPYELIVSESGVVESVRLLPYTGSCNFTKSPPNPPPFVANHLTEASSLTREQRFIPWTINGQPTRVLIHTVLPIAPPERFGTSRSLPVPVDARDIVMSLERHGCEGRCPVYSITIAGNGSVIYEGRTYVKVLGTQQTKISEAAALQLFERFREADFGSALPRYIGAYDGGENVLRVQIDGKSYQVVDDSGLKVGLPTAIFKLERAIDDAAQSRRWVSGE